MRSNVYHCMQSVANIVYALGKLKHSLPPTTCQRVEDLVTAETTQPFRDVEAANILYGFVRMSYQAPKLVELLERRCRLSYASLNCSFDLIQLSLNL